MRVSIHSHTIKKVFRLENMSNETEERIKEGRSGKKLSEDVDLRAIVHSYVLFKKAMTAAKLADTTNDSVMRLMAQEAFKTNMDGYVLALQKIGVSGRTFARSAFENIEWSRPSKAAEDRSVADLLEEAAKLRDELEGNMKSLWKGVEMIGLKNLEIGKNG